MDIVKNQDMVAVECGNLIQQACENRLNGGQLGGFEASEEVATKSRLQRSQSGYEVGEKSKEFVVRLVQRNPCAWDIKLLNPMSHQGGLAKSRRRRNEGQLASQPRAQFLFEARPKY